MSGIRLLGQIEGANLREQARELGKMPTLHPVVQADFPTSLVLSITPPPALSSHTTNVLILLHGLGDTAVSFTSLGKQLALPETTCISLQAPTPLPLELGGFHWGDDITFDQASGQMDFDTGFNKAVKIIKRDIIENGLIKKCGYKAREIMLFGFGQGAMAALATAASVAEELGGIVSIGGPLPSSNLSPKAVKTPVLVLGGSSSTLITRTALDKLKAAFQNVEYQKWNRAGDGMPRNRDEMLPIMRFFARQLRSRAGVPEGSVENVNVGPADKAQRLEKQRLSRPDLKQALHHEEKTQDSNSYMLAVVRISGNSGGTTSSKSNDESNEVKASDLPNALI